MGAPGDDDGGENRGAVYVLTLAPSGTVLSHQKISSLTGGFTGKLGASDAFGAGLGVIGDLDSDGIVDLAVGALGTTNSAARSGSSS